MPIVVVVVVVVAVVVVVVVVVVAVICTCNGPWPMQFHYWRRTFDTSVPTDILQLQRQLEVSRNGYVIFRELNIFHLLQLEEGYVASKLPYVPPPPRHTKLTHFQFHHLNPQHPSLWWLGYPNGRPCVACGPPLCIMLPAAAFVNCVCVCVCVCVYIYIWGWVRWKP